jgi:hypothetical protein
MTRELFFKFSFIFDDNEGNWGTDRAEVTRVTIMAEGAELTAREVVAVYIFGEVRDSVFAGEHLAIMGARIGLVTDDGDFCVIFFHYRR